MFKPNQMIRTKEGDFDIIEYVTDNVQGCDPDEIVLFCRNGTYTSDDVAMIEGELSLCSTT